MRTYKPDEEQEEPNEQSLEDDNVFTGTVFSSSLFECNRSSLLYPTQKIRINGIGGQGNIKAAFVNVMIQSCKTTIMKKSHLSLSEKQFN